MKKRPSSVCFIAFCLLLVCCNLLKSSAQELNKEALDYLSYYKNALPDSLKNKINLDDSKVIMDIGSNILYFGKNKIGNELMNYAIAKSDKVTGDDYHKLSVQNTKNGNFIQAIDALEKAIVLDPKINGYYGWVLLYYYHDYKRALECLEAYDLLTPGFSDAPVGEDIHTLKALAKMQLGNYEEAIEEFNINIAEVTAQNGEYWVPIYTYFYKGRCFQKLNKMNEAIFCYDQSIKMYEQNTEAYFYKGLTLIEMGRKKEGCENLQNAFSLINQGNKQSDVYVELFDEVYKQDIERAIENHCSK